MNLLKETHQELISSINRKRSQMIALAELQGIHTKETLEKSRELDVLIIRYMKKCL
ncbi:aspartyl-phosphate phosphatase Spo0E family protein [Pullulanibacillus sp. KACC 23026]|uniref:aspartyl-phosphate phosphatase Spo0E family protein n=1 Tax=Pullulanibacillus sp. KACC 23026 TaxID=3028315 RepID=UPI0023B0631B|nr:aspartyl-phosphate phosphatase Spo0E family protein [Pullulanibacillus sp. KACC 23026]WEG12547.1 aspartyl-phosphate phosphatase Spo0E family protein [Pullulanibacillus sp. KACC 23026]